MRRIIISEVCAKPFNWQVFNCSHSLETLYLSYDYSMLKFINGYSPQNIFCPTKVAGNLCMQCIFMDTPIHQTHL